MSTLTANKVGALFVFFGTSFLGVWVPYFIPVRQNFLKFGLLFASGLFLSIAFLHLSAECVHVFGEFYTGDYPYPFLVIVLGFYMTWFADIIAGSIWSKRTPGQQAQVKDIEKTTAPSCGKVGCCKSSDALGEGESKCGGSGCDCPGQDACQCPDLSTYKLTEEGPSVTGALAAIGTSSATVAADGAEIPAARTLSFLDVVLLLVALCFHAFFEGLAVGLAKTTASMWNLTVSICLNEFFEGLALGTTLRAQDVKRHAFHFFLYALGASVVAPLGIVVGIVLITSISVNAAEWAEGIGNGLAAGVFICIATRHVIAKAMVPNGPNEPLWVPFLKFFVSGLGLMVNSLTTLRSEG